MKKASVVTVLVLLSALGVGSLWGQSQNTSQIQGTVLDASGSAVPGAEIKVTQTDTGITRTTTSGAAGDYVLANLPIGPYRVEVSKQGFSTFVQTGLVLQVATNPTVDVSLKVGGVNEQIQVEANAAQVETEATGVGQVMENRRILELPLNGRLATDLINLTPGVVTQGVAGAGGFPNTANPVIAGSQSNGLAYFLDGSIFNNPWDNANIPFPFPDALQEFKVETSALTAQNGTHAGAAITAVTKSGTNGFHGDAFDFFRNGDLNARNALQPTRDTLKRNQYGGTIGGPIRKDKVFFFFGYQGTKTRQDPSSVNAFVPTPAMLTGNFSACPTDLGALASQPNLFVGGNPGSNQLLSSLFDPASLKLAGTLPASTNGCGQTSFGEVTKINEGQYVGRVDYQLTQKESVFVRYTTTAYFRPPSYTFTPDNILSTGQGGFNDRTQSAIIGDTYLFSPTTVNAFRVAYDRIAIARSNADFYSACDLGVQMYCGYLPHQSYFSVTGDFTVGVPTGTHGVSHSNTYQLTDDVTLVRGKHQITLGGNGSNYRMAFYGTVYAQNMFNFPSIGAFLEGQFNSNDISLPNDLIQRKYFASGYAADTWKVTPKLTVNLGLRWEPFLPPNMTNGAIYNFSLARFYADEKSTVYDNAPPGLTFPGDPGFQGQSGMNKHWDLWAPRVGLAYDPKGDGKMVIRASYGISYDYANGQLFVNTADAPPFGGTESFAASTHVTDPFTNLYASNPGGNIFPYTVNANAPFVAGGAFIAIPPNLQIPEVHQWNFVVQRQFGRDWIASATYVGSESEHLLDSYQLNPATIVACPGGAALTTCNSTGNQNSRRVFELSGVPQANLYGYVDTYDSGATSSYNGLILAVQKALSKGVSANANYTWSHCIGDLTVGNSTGNAGAGLDFPYNRAYDKSNCQNSQIGGVFSSDRRQIFNSSIVYETPKLANHWMDMAFSSWRLSGVYRAQSAAWLTVSLSTDISLTSASAANQRPIQVLADPLCANPSPSCWINKAAFATPAPGTFSPMGRDNVPGPSFFQIDAAAEKLFRITERQNLEFRVEAFNLSNSFRAGIPLPSLSAGGSGLSTTFGTSTFGTVTAALDPRIVQLALKYTF
jgi:Carboxypeptidase regulatory-like domain